MNVSGGLLSKGHPIGMTGAAGVVEITTQLRGEAGDRQIEGAKVGMAHVIGLGSSCAIHILEKVAAKGLFLRAKGSDMRSVRSVLFSVVFAGMVVALALPAAAAVRTPRPRGGTNRCLNTHGTSAFYNRDAEDIQAILQSAVPNSLTTIEFSAYSIAFFQGEMSVGIDFTATLTAATGYGTGLSLAEYRVRNNRIVIDSVSSNHADITVTLEGATIEVPVDFPTAVEGQRVPFTCAGSRLTVFPNGVAVVLRKEPNPLA